MTRGLCEYQREHLKDIGIEVPLDKKIHITDGAASSELIRAKKNGCEIVNIVTMHSLQ